MLFKQNARTDQPQTSSRIVPSAKLALPPASSGELPTDPPIGAGSERAAGIAKPDREEGSKRLIVGEGIELRGEITACDRLVVEGQVEVTLNETRVLEIRPSGRFAGCCEVEEALVSGIYEGDLIVRGRLTVREGGRVSGSIAYGEIELERGAQIAGQLSMRDDSKGSPARRDAA